MYKALIAILILNIPFPTLSSDEFWVTSDRLNRRTCPATSCGVVGQLFYREQVKVFERKSDWIRITKYYDAFCQNGTSNYVDSGNAHCIPENGIVDAKFAEWVSVKYLSSQRPTDPGKNASGVAKAIAQSDDYRIYQQAFTVAAESLIKSKKCTFSELKEIGGFIKSSKYKNQPIYFTYCGGSTASNKIHLNAETGQLFK
ncbi:SH3 domain-containing protein [Shewanella canadensis]|uniref:SH3 domain-containing protein n=1 Tax=Shewanella canadensis TaxID=271096 RepID=A0A431WX24_9GAMM|nr:SH3 domain-containing protein [Shewanella canadensis]RTR40056.1 SH3 domain-containing protein [Shewanella canadensis]